MVSYEDIDSVLGCRDTLPEVKERGIPLPHEKENENEMAEEESESYVKSIIDTKRSLKEVDKLKPKVQSTKREQREQMEAFEKSETRHYELMEKQNDREKEGGKRREGAW